MLILTLPVSHRPTYATHLYVLEAAVCWKMEGEVDQVTWLLVTLAAPVRRMAGKNSAHLAHISTEWSIHNEIWNTLHQS